MWCALAGGLLRIHPGVIGEFWLAFDSIAHRLVGIIHLVIDWATRGRYSQGNFLKHAYSGELSLNNSSDSDGHLSPWE